MPPSGVCLHSIGPAVAMVIAVAVVQNTNKTQLLAGDYHTVLLAELSIFVTRNGPFTHVIDATSFVTMWDATIQKEAISFISSYQMMTEDKFEKLLSNDKAR